MLNHSFVRCCDLRGDKRSIVANLRYDGILVRFRYYGFRDRFHFAMLLALLGAEGLLPFSFVAERQDRFSWYVAVP
jgi:hypothetical protein